MLAKNNRYFGAKSIYPVIKYGEIRRGGALQLRRLATNKHESFRFAVSVSKKVDKKAVVRNRIRRIYYESLRLNSSSLPKGTDLFLVVHSSNVLQQDPKQRTEQLLKLLNQH
jgi:ribonuclease P protein component